MTQQRSTIVSRTVLMTSAVAAIAVIVAGIVAYPLVRASTLSRTQATLAQLADLTTAALDRSVGAERRHRGELLSPELTDALRREQVRGFLVFADAAPPPGLTPAQLSRLFDGQSLSLQGESALGTLLIEARPLQQPGAAVVLEQPVEVVGGSALSLLSRVGVALVVGLLLAVLLGIVFARRLARPLRLARDAAYQMASGERDLRLTPEGPSEIADIAESLNHLSDALAISEARQREFLLSVSHEFRTPLTAVKGYAEALADGVIAGDEVERTGATMATEASRLDRLVNDLLDLARMGADNFHITPVADDLARIGREASEVWASRCAASGVGFIADIPDTSVPTFTDPMRVRQVIDNLAENALRVSPEGSVIVLAVRNEWPWAVLEVRDSGPGLTGDDLAVAFEPGTLYERYRGVRPVGTGLGLALVGRLARSLSGVAEAGRATEGGARFTVRLPSADRPVSSNRPAAADRLGSGDPSESR